MIENQILEFSVLCNLNVISGYTISIVSASIDKASYRSVLENVYADLENTFRLRSPFLGQDNMLIFILCSKDKIALDSFTRKLESYVEVKRVDVFITTGIEYFKDVIIREIERKIQTKERAKGISLNTEKIQTLLLEDILNEKPFSLFCLK
jgi:hypothetical protein